MRRGAGDAFRLLTASFKTWQYPNSVVCASLQAQYSSAAACTTGSWSQLYRAHAHVRVRSPAVTVEGLRLCISHIHLQSAKSLRVLVAAPFPAGPGTPASSGKKLDAAAARNRRVDEPRGPRRSGSPNRDKKTKTPAALARTFREIWT